MNNTTHTQRCETSHKLMYSANGYLVSVTDSRKVNPPTHNQIDLNKWFPGNPNFRELSKYMSDHVIPPRDIKSDICNNTRPLLPCMTSCVKKTHLDGNEYAECLSADSLSIKKL